MATDEWGDEYTSPDIEQIRATLAIAVQPKPPLGLRVEWATTRNVLSQNSIAWLASLCDEVDRLRERNTYIRHCNDVQADKLRAQRTEIERLFGKALDMSTALKQTEAECERLRNSGDLLASDIAQGMSNLWRMAYDSGYQAGHGDGYTKGQFYPERL